MIARLVDALASPDNRGRMVAALVALAVLLAVADGVLASSSGEPPLVYAVAGLVGGIVALVGARVLRAVLARPADHYRERARDGSGDDAA